MNIEEMKKALEEIRETICTQTRTIEEQKVLLAAQNSVFKTIGLPTMPDFSGLMDDEEHEK